jgi:N-acetyl-alpha-D-muramate 1-phosphate uridylyltransferase
MKAMLLAAGRGSRMRPLTDEIPKPLLPIAGKPFIAYQLLKLANIGIKDIIINVSYRAKQIISTLEKGHAYGVNIEYSFEPRALDTGGGIVQALPLLGDAPFLVLSADIWTEYPLEKLSQYSLSSAQAHLVLVDNPDFHPQGDFHLLPNKLLSLDNTSRFTFANCGIYHPSFFQNYNTGTFPLGELLRTRIAEKKVTGEYYSGKWFNVGSLRELARFERYLSR